MMRIRTWVASVVLLAAIGVGAWASPFGTAGEPSLAPASEPQGPVTQNDPDEPVRPQPLPRKPVTAEQVLEWRKEYPFRSLVGRLEYEAERVPKTSPPLTREAEQALRKESEFQSFGAHIRSRSFQMLHDEQVAEFVTKSGFGVSRVPQPTRDKTHYDLPEVKPIAFDKIPAGSDEGPPLKLPPTYKASAAAEGTAKLMPNLEQIQELHGRSSYSFTDQMSFGYVKSKDQVVGFSSHRIRDKPWLPIDDAQYVPQQDLAIPQKHWKLVRLELTSLLKHDTPRVYVSENLPRMEDLSSTRTRELSKFETEALVKLRAGEDLITTATSNRIEMYGSLRASEQCTRCHEVPPGTLLGAFSYDLRRDPPLKDVPTAKGIQ